MTLVHSDSPQSAFDHLLDAIGRMQQDPLAQCWLVAPSRNWGDRILQALAKKQGIASGVSTSNLRALLESIAKTDPRRCLSVDSLALLILESIRQTPQEPESLIHSALGETDEARPLRELALAQSLAEAMDAAWLHPKSDQSFLARPEIQGLLTKEAIKAAGTDHLGRISRESFEAACRSWLKTQQAKGGSVRLAILLDRSAPAVLLERLEQLLEIVDGALVVSAPVNDFWADDTLKTRARKRSGTVPQTPAPHLLYALGTNAQDLHRGLIEQFESTGTGFLYPTAENDETPDSLLAAVQQDTRSLHLRETPFVRSPEDSSLIIYSCRSPRRELEVIADQFRGELSRNPELKPEDCRILLVNPSDYAPLIKSVFAEAGVPIHFPEVPPQQSLEVIAALNALVEALRGRFELAEGLRLLQQPPITRQFQLEDALVDGELGNWLRDAGVRWGRNREHRIEAQQQPLSGDTWSWAFGLQRLALGAALPASVNNTRIKLASDTHHVPLLRAAGLQTATLARLAEFLDLFDQHAARWKRGTTRTLDAWCDAITDLCATFFDDASQDQVLVLSSKVVAPLRKSNLPPHETNASNAFLQSEISAEVFLRLFNSRLEALSEQLMRGDRMSGVLVSDLRKDAALPAQILAVAGLGGEQFPRADTRADWHPLKNATGIGLPSKRGEDRHFLLQAVLCPQRRLLLTYVGGSLHDDKPLPPSTPLADLLEAVAKTAGPHTVADIQVNVPLHQFSSAAFRSSLPLFARGQQPAHYQEARILATSQKSDALRFHRAPLPIEPRSVVDVTELKRTLVEPHKIYLARLGLGWFDQPRAFPSGALLGLNSLEKWVLRDWILKERLAAADSARGPSESDASRELLGLMGKLPQAPRDLKIWEKEAAKAPVVPQEPSRPHPAIQLKINGVELTGQIDPHWRINGDIATLYTAGESKPKYELRALVDALVLSLAAPELKVFRIQFAKKDPEAKSHPPKDISQLLAEPEETLKRILELHQLALCVPLPFFIEASEELKDANADDQTSCLASALEKWKSKASFRENAKDPEAEALSVQIAFAGIEDPFAEDYELPEGFAMETVPENPAEKLSITLAKFIFGLVPTPSKPDSKSKKALS